MNAKAYNFGGEGLMCVTFNVELASLGAEGVGGDARVVGLMSRHELHYDER